VIYGSVDVQITYNMLGTGESVTSREVMIWAYWIIPMKSMYHLSASLQMNNQTHQPESGYQKTTVPHARVIDKPKPYQ